MGLSTYTRTIKTNCFQPINMLMLISKQCPQCNTPIPKEKRANKFCCQSCAATYNNLRHGRRHGNPAGTCERCGQPKGDAGRKFCSSKCFGNGRDTPSKETVLQRKREYSANYRAKLRDQTPIDADRKAIREFYSSCPKGWEVDHIIPISKGGLHTLENLQYLPMSENRSKGSKILVPAAGLEPARLSEGF